MTNIECPLCGNTDAVSDFIPSLHETPRRDVYTGKMCWRCDSCGLFYIVPDASILEDNKYLIAGYLFEIQNRNTTKPFILDNISIQQILTSPIVPHSIFEKQIKCLRYISDNTKYYGELILIPVISMYARNMNEGYAIINYLSEKGFVKDYSTDSGLCSSITFDGLSYNEKYLQKSKMNQCFVAMWFNPETDDLWKKAIKPGCLDAGYNPVRIDKHQHNNNIVDEILAGIRKSRFLIADFSGQNRGVYYEAGFAKGLGKEVIQLCREDHFEKKIDKDTNMPISDIFMHFDNVQINTLLWVKGEEEKIMDRIQFRIESVFGHGNFK